MNRYFILVLRAGSIIVFLTVISQGSGAQRPNSSSELEQQQKGQARAPLGATSIARVDQIFRAFVSREQSPGLAVAIARDGVVVWDKAYGQADLESGVPATSRTLFRIGSIAKAITAVAILQLARARGDQPRP